MTTHTESPMATLAEVRARYLPQLGKNKLYLMAADGTLPGVRKFGGRYLVSRAELEKALGMGG